MALDLQELKKDEVTNPETQRGKRLMVLASFLAPPFL
jgi:hypothetical protein